MFKIERGIPLPPASKARKYSFDEMEVGDSVFFEDVSLRRKFYNAAKAMGKRHGYKFSSRKVDGGFRIWRVA